MHYEPAPGKAFACHCLHLFEGVSARSCFFWLFLNKILLQNIGGSMETRGGEKSGAQGDDGLSTPGSFSNISDRLFSCIGVIKDLIHIRAEGCWVFLNLTHFSGAGRTSKLALVSRSTSHDQSQSEPCPTTITCFPGYSGGIRVQVQDGPTILFHYWPITQDSFEPVRHGHKSAFSQGEPVSFRLAFLILLHITMEGRCLLFMCEDQQTRGRHGKCIQPQPFFHTEKSF